MPSIQLTQVSCEQYSREVALASLPLYAQTWWHGCVAPRAMHYYLAYYKSRVVAYVPLFMPIKGVVLTPPLSQSTALYFSPLFNEEEWGAKKQFTIKRQVVEALCSLLQPYKYIELQFPADVQDLLPFYWQGASLHVKYNYQRTVSADDNSDGYNMDIRQKLKQAENAGCSFTLQAPEQQVAELLVRHGTQKGIAQHYLRAMQQVASSLQKGKNGFVAAAYSADGRLIGTCVVPIEHQTAYLIASATASSSTQHEYANAYMLHQTLLECRQRGVTLFDFEGSMLRGVEQTFRSMGGEQHTYIKVSRGKLRLASRYRLRRYYQQVHKSY